jgi:WXG100 family type VII secretion target
MSANIVRAEYDTLESIAQRFQSRADAMEQVRAAVARGVEALQQGGWEGEGAAAFFAESQDVILPAIQRLVTALETAGAVTLEISAILQRADADAAKPFQQGDTDVAGGTRGALGMAGDFAMGVLVDGALESVLGIVNAVLHPIDSLNGLAYAITHPVEMWEAIKEPYVEDWENGHPARAIGRGVFEIGSMFVGVGLIAKGGKMAAQATGLLSKSGKLAAKATMLASKTGQHAAILQKYASRYPDVTDAAKVLAKTTDPVIRNEMIEYLAVKHTHLVGEPTRAVLGRYREVGGYLAEAEKGGVFFQMSDEVYHILGKQTAVEVNLRSLQHMRAANIPRIEFHDWTPYDRRIDLLEAEFTKNPAKIPARVSEWIDMRENGARDGYVRDGMNFIKRDPPVAPINPRPQPGFGKK